MATTAVNFGAHLWARVELGATTGAFSSGDTYNLINYCQKILNVGRALIVSSTGTFTYTSGTALYTVATAVGTGCARVLSLYESSLTVQRVRFTELKQYDRNWYAAVDSSGAAAYRCLAWAPLGEDMLAIYPKPSSGGTLSCSYVINTTLIDAGTDELEIPDKDLPLLYDLCEIVLLAHLRRLVEAAAKMTRFNERLGLVK